MTTLVFPPPVVLTPAQSYVHEEWEEKRSIITRLYRDEARSLYDVRVILAEQHDFRPTVAMLKKRINKWALDRKHKQADMLAALRVASQREAQGKKTVFLIRGRLVTFRDIKQYFRRKGFHDLQSLVADVDAAIPTTRLDCRTPEPGATANDIASHHLEALTDTKGLAPHHSFSIGNIGVGFPLVALPDPNQVDPMMPLTGVLSHLEQLLQLGRTYYSGVFENPGWGSMDQIFELGPLESFYRHMFDGQILLEKRSCDVEAFKLFDRAFDLIRHLLNKRLLLLLPYMYCMMIQFRGIRGQAVITLLLDFICQMAQTCYQEQHPVQSSLALLRNMSAEDRANSSERALHSLLDRVRVESTPVIRDELEIRSTTICHGLRQCQTCLPFPQTLNNFMLTFITLCKLVAELEILKIVSGPKHWHSFPFSFGVETLTLQVMSKRGFYCWIGNFARIGGIA